MDGSALASRGGLGRCTHVFDLLERFTWPLAIMPSAKQIPVKNPHSTMQWVLFNAVANNTFSIGGRNDDDFVAAPRKILAHVTAPRGYMNTSRKSEIHVWVSSAILEITTPQDHAKGDSAPVNNAEAVGQPRDGPRST
jgi:hypothetical protein